MPDLSVASIRADIDSLFRNAPAPMRLLASLRPFICPFDVVLREVPKDSSALDIGCGQGLLINLLAYRGLLRSGTGFEPNPLTLRVAQKMAEEAGYTHLSFTQGFEPSALPQGPFDIVLMIDVMHHVNVTDQKALFMAAAQRVAVGGRLIYKDMAEKPLWCAWVNRLHDLILARQIIHYVPIETVRLWAKEAGLRIVKDEAMRRLAYAHELLVMEKA